MTLAAFLPQLDFAYGNKFQSSERLIVYDFKRKNAGVLTKYYANAQGLDMDKSGTRFAYVLDGNVYISEKGNNYQVTNDGGNGIKNGEAVHRHEFGIEKGTFWSPNSNFGILQNGRNHGYGLSTCGRF